MPVLFPTWLILAAVFFYLAYSSYRAGQQSPRRFRLRGKGKGGNAELREFAEDFNHYLDALSAQLKSQSQVAALGYFLVGVLSLISSVTIIQALLPR
ncbi:MAG: hypothetical protein WD906_02320 [Anaerolineales bacterium]|jgi:hypothetical protein